MFFVMENKKKYYVDTPSYLELWSNACVSEPLPCSIKDASPTFNFQPIRLLDPGYGCKFTYLMTNSAYPDQLASSSQLI